MKKVVWVILIIGIFAFFRTQASDMVYHFDDPKKQIQFRYLLKEMRCLVCQNQDLSDSNSGLAEDLRARIYNMVREGKSDSDIIQYFTERYGDFIMFKPPLKWITFILWFSPLLFVMAGLYVFTRKCISSK